jgi:PEP-CTERM motif
MRYRTLTSLAVSLVAAQLLWSAPARAMLIQDIRNIDVTLDSSSPTYDGSFDLSGQGVPTSATVNWAAVSFTLIDTAGQVDSVSALLEGQPLFGGLGTANPVLFSVFGGLVDGSIIVNSLNVDGMLAYTLNLLGSGSVRVSTAALAADVTSVPEPGTLSLLGAGLIAGWLGRRRRTRTS